MTECERMFKEVSMASSKGLFQNLFRVKETENQVKMRGLRAKIRTQYLQNTVTRCLKAGTAKPE
jgi:hypothetical protein